MAALTRSILQKAPRTWRLQLRPLSVKSLDHIVITCKDMDRTMDFYSKLGMKTVEFGRGRKALTFGRQKINLHQKGQEFEPKALVPQPGSQDLCFVLGESIGHAQKHLQEAGIAVIEGPVQRTGAEGPILSIYIRDPDQNLIELSSYEEGEHD